MIDALVAPVSFGSMSVDGGVDSTPTASPTFALSPKRSKNSDETHDAISRLQIFGWRIRQNFSETEGRSEELDHRLDSQKAETPVQQYREYDQLRAKLPHCAESGTLLSDLKEN